LENKEKENKMNSRLQEWLNTKGVRLIELKESGNDILNNHLSEQQLTEYFILIGQLDGILWALQPRNSKKYTEFHNDVKKIFAKMEKECKNLKKLTGKVRIPKGRA
jgi:hypothetical protein